MKDKNNTYHFKECGLSIFFMAILLWLTLSAPFIFDVQKKLLKPDTSLTSSDMGQSIEENANPFSGLSEEKSGGNTSLSEYLHEHFHMPVLSASQLIHEDYTGNSIYVAYYGELLSPPPEI